MKLEEMVAPVTSDSGHQRPVKTNKGEDDSEGEDDMKLAEEKVEGGKWHSDAVAHGGAN